MKIWNGITRTYLEVTIGDGQFLLLDGTPLYRIETKGRTGKVLYSNSYYLDPKTGKEKSAYGMDGATGHGWGGKIIGYLTEKEIQYSPIKIR